MLELTRVRDKKGKYKHSSWHNFKKRKRGWREYATHPITVSVFGLVAYVGMHTAYAMNELQRLDGRVEIIRESSAFTVEAARADNDHGELVQADSWKDSLKEERDGTPISDVVSLSNESIEGKIREAWIGTGQEDVAVAVAKSESGLRTDAMGWNCYYYNAQGKRYSKACLPQDREKAWSVDCGVMQINHIGKTCPAYLFDPDENIKLGREKYDNSEKRIGIGFYPWMAYRNNLHLKYL